MTNVDVHFCRAQIIRLFNEGILTTVSADWYRQQGFSVVCAGGKVIDIVREEA